MARCQCKNSGEIQLTEEYKWQHKEAGQPATMQKKNALLYEHFMRLFRFLYLFKSILRKRNKMLESQLTLQKDTKATRSFEESKVF